MSRLRLRMSRNVLGLLWLVTWCAACGPSAAQDRGFQDTLQPRVKSRAGKPTAKMSFDLVRGDRQGEILLKIAAVIPPDHWIYAIAPEDPNGPDTTIEVDETGLEPLDEVYRPDHEPKRYFEPLFDANVEKFTDKVVWTRRYRLLPGVDATTARVAGKVIYQICDDTECRPDTVKFEVSLPPAENADARVEEEDDVIDLAPPAGAPLSPPSVFRAGNVLGGPGESPMPEILSILVPVKDSSEVLLEIRVKIPPQYNVYSTGKNGGAGTVFKLGEVKGLVAVDNRFTADRDPELVEDGPRKLEEFFDHVTWSRRYRLESPDALESASVEGAIDYQICGQGGCRSYTHTFVATTQGDPGKSGRPGESWGAEDTEPDDRGEAASEALPGGVGVAAVGGLDKSGGLLWFMLRAMGFGFAALLTPCAFPMVPITVSFFHKQSEKANHKPVGMALAYCGGIVATFTILGIVMSALFGGAVLNQLANNGWFNLGLALLLVFFALNLLGMFEIRIPAWLLTYTANQEGRGGLVGVLFMALTFTLTSFTCTFAFVGTVLVDAANGGRLWPAAGLFAFSAAFSLPFFFLALFPSFLQRLPKSGGWMNSIKVVMGMIELGAAFKFFSVADLSWNPDAVVFDYELVMSAWMIISIASAMYLFSMFRLPHDTPRDHIGVGRFMAAMTFLGLAAYLAVGLYSTEKPTGSLYGLIEATAPPKFKGGNEQFGPALEHGGVKYALDFEKAVDYAAKNNKPLLLDFTGVNCVNCRKMEAGPLSQPAVTARLKNFVCVQVYADRVPHIADQAERRRLLAKNHVLQSTWFGELTLPSYAVIPADPNLVARKNPGDLLSLLVGYDESVERFTNFLDTGYGRWKQLEARQQGNRVVGKR